LALSAWTTNFLMGEAGSSSPFLEIIGILNFMNANIQKKSIHSQLRVNLFEDLECSSIATIRFL
jgi:hypothetical protein